MTQPPRDPASGGEPEENRPGPHEGQPYGGWPSYGEPPYGQQQPYGQPYGQQPYGGRPGYGAPSAVLAGRWARLGAGVIDLIIIGIVTGLISIPFVNWNRVINPEPGTSMYSGAQVGTNAISIVLAFLYFWLMHAKWGQTLGKMLLRIRVVRDDNGQAITNGQALGRAAFYGVLGGICGCIGLIDIAWILWDPRKQALHCKVAHTVVVTADPRLPNPYDYR
ncbi:RDD family protein [Actinomadura formosensis]|uniref:RDD family protein n=1 Tax=Actinomadura formosensis TaxID=60706 RepID=UPI003D93362B